MPVFLYIYNRKPRTFCGAWQDYSLSFSLLQNFNTENNPDVTHVVIPTTLAEDC